MKTYKKITITLLVVLTTCISCKESEQKNTLVNYRLFQFYIDYSQVNLNEVDTIKLFKECKNICKTLEKRLFTYTKQKILCKAIKYNRLQLFLPNDVGIPQEIIELQGKISITTGINNDITYPFLCNVDYLKTKCKEKGDTELFNCLLPKLDKNCDPIKSPEIGTYLSYPYYHSEGIINTIMSYSKINNFLPELKLVGDIEAPFSTGRKEHSIYAVNNNFMELNLTRTKIEENTPRPEYYNVTMEFDKSLVKILNDFYEIKSDNLFVILLIDNKYVLESALLVSRFNKPIIGINHDNESAGKRIAYDIIVKNQISFPLINEYTIKVNDGNVDTLGYRRILDP